MAWKDPRGSGSAVVAVAARTTAHRDDAKARTDDASAAARRGFPRKLLVGGGALVLVAGAVVFAVSQSGEDSDTPLAVAAAADPTSAAPSASEDPEPTPEEVLAGSVPTGKWKMVQTFKYSIQRNGQRSQSWSYDPINRTWKFPPADCTAAACTGTLRSSSGSTFEFTWDGKPTGSRGAALDGARGQGGLRQHRDGRGAADRAVRRAPDLPLRHPGLPWNRVSDGHGHGDPRDAGVVRRLQ